MEVRATAAAGRGSHGATHPQPMGGGRSSELACFPYRFDLKTQRVDTQSVTRLNNLFPGVPLNSHDIFQYQGEVC